MGKAVALKHVAGGGDQPDLLSGGLQAQGAQLTVLTTDDGDNTGSPKSSQITLPIIVSNANLAPIIGDISNTLTTGAVQGSTSAVGAGTTDLNGDGQITPTDRQVLYANYGWCANQAPVAAATLPTLKTHTDLAKDLALNTLAQDLEGDTVFWRVLGSTHGTAKLSNDGQILLFTPKIGYVGQAVVRVQADDGFAVSNPIELTVNVSGAKLLAIHLGNLPQLQVGQSARLQASVDFEDEKGVAIVTGDYLTLTAADLTGMGFVGSNAIATDDVRDTVRAKAAGPALVSVTRIDSDGRLVKAVAALNVAAAALPYDPNAEEGGYESPESLAIEPDVYPGTLSLAPGGQRQLKVHLADVNSGAQIDIHTAGQTVFAGTPETVEYYLDPATQDPLVDPVTGEIMLDPVTGEVLLDPSTGTTVQIVTPAVPAVYSGTRYIVSDATIATVSEDGLITALKAGSVTVSIVHLGSRVDADGHVAEQVIGQSDIRLTVAEPQLTDDDAATPAPQRVEVSKAQGGVVSAVTGETVMIGAGALAGDTAVSIRRIDVQHIAALTGLAPPATDVLQAVGAFTLDLGATPTQYPLQLAIPVQSGITAQPGEEVLFFRKGTVLTRDGSYQPTWWLVDNGTIGTDAQGNAIARTASPPL